jgi:hypothetical protein
MSSMPISSHCICPWLSVSAGRRDGPAEDHPGHLVHAFDHIIRALPKQRAGDIAAARQRQFEILEGGQVLVDGRRWNLRPMPTARFPAPCGR